MTNHNTKMSNTIHIPICIVIGAFKRCEPISNPGGDVEHFAVEPLPSARNVRLRQCKLGENAEK